MVKIPGPAWGNGLLFQNTAPMIAPMGRVRGWSHELGSERTQKWTLPVSRSPVGLPLHCGPRAFSFLQAQSWKSEIGVSEAGFPQASLLGLLTAAFSLRPQQRPAHSLLPLCAPQLLQEGTSPVRLGHTLMAHLTLIPSGSCVPHTDSLREGA